MRRSILSLTLVAVLAGGVPASRSTADEPPATQPKAPEKPKVPTEKVTIANETFKLELAVTEAARSKGLMGRTTIPRDGGMLFVFTRPQYLSFWMKNCKTDMDLMFLDKEGKVVAIHRMKKEPLRRKYESQLRYERRLKRYPSRKLAPYAIELRPLSVDRLRIKVGSTIELDHEKLAKLAK